MTERLSPRAGLLGGLLLWFAVLGGALSWAVHLVAAWSIDELACAAGHEELAGFSLTTAVGLAVIVPGLVAAAALACASFAWRRTRPAGPAGGERAVRRAHTLAFIGLWLDLLALTIIVLGGVAVLVLPPCQR